MIAALRRLPMSASEACLGGALVLLFGCFFLNSDTRPMPLDGVLALGAMALIGFAMALDRSRSEASETAAEESETPSMEMMEAAVSEPAPTFGLDRSAGMIRALRAAQAFEAEICTRVTAGFDELTSRIAEEAQKSATSSIGQAQLSMSLIQAIQGVTKSINTMHGAIGDLHGKTQSMSSATDAFSVVSDTIAERARESKIIANQTAETVGAAGDVVNSLQRATGRIGDVVALINEITTKTHLLALNAGIEASRAGDAGRGFAVVASEVQKLAAQTQDATTQIRQHIDNVQSAVEAVVTNVEKAKGNISDMEAVSDAVIATIDEQRVNIENILNAISAAVTGARDVHSAMEGTKSEADTAVSLSDDVYMNSMTIESDADILKSVLTGAVGQARDASLQATITAPGPHVCLVRTSGAEQTAILRDVSCAGALLCDAPDPDALTAGARVDIAAHDGSSRVGAVACWPESAGVRIRFETPLSTDDLGRFLSGSTPMADGDDMEMDDAEMAA